MCEHTGLVGVGWDVVWWISKSLGAVGLMRGACHSAVALGGEGQKRARVTTPGGTKLPGTQPRAGSELDDGPWTMRLTLCQHPPERPCF